MSSRLGTLTLDLIAKTGNFVGPIDKASKQVRKTLDEAAEQAKKAGAALGAAAAIGSAALVKLTTDGLQLVDSQAKLARSLDTSFDSITALNMAFGDGGINDFEASLNRLNRRLGAAELGRGAALKTVEELGLNLRELSQLDAAERIAVIADRIREVATSSQQAARFAQDLGFEQAAAAQLFLEGGDNIRQYVDDVEALGLSVSDFDASQIEAANDALGIFGDITQGIQQQLAVEAAPFLQVIGEEIENAVRKAGGFDDVVAALFENLVTGAGFAADAFSGIGRTFEIVANAVVVTAAETLNFLSGGLARTLSILDSIPTVRLLIDDDDIRSLREFQAIQQDVARQGFEVIRDELERPLPSAAIDDWLQEAKARTEEARKAFEEQAGGVDKVKDRTEAATEAQKELNKTIKESADLLSDQSDRFAAPFEQYVRLAQSDLASGSRFFEDRIRTLRELIEAQKRSGENPTAIAERELIVAQLTGGQMQSSGGGAQSGVPQIAQQGFDLAKQAYDATKQIADNTLLTANTLVSQMEKEQADPIGTIVLQIPGSGAQSPFEVRLQGAESELQRLRDFVNNFTNDAARVAAGG